MKRQLHLFYSGTVQGIGFRYTVMDIASQLKVGGWVKNLDDGRVEIIAEASEGILKNFLQEVNQHFCGYIKDLNTEWLPAGKQDGEFRDFQVQF